MQDYQLPERFAGRYSVIRALGAGGMGRVFEVYDTVVGRIVALKVMREEIRYHDSLAPRFHREYRAMARLRHPGVPRVHDAGIDSAGRAYFTMELVGGQPMTTALGEVSAAPHLLALAMEVARILVDVHAAGIVHRDVKPCNILVGADGRLSLVDFGAAHLAEPEVSCASPTAVAPLRTGPGTWLGTPGYVDPAMLEGFPCSPRSDVYSLAATIAWMFTRVHPSADPDAPIPCTGITAVDRLLRRGMARSPEDRPATAAQFLVELTNAEAALRPRPSAPQPLPAPSPRTRRFAPELVLALGVFGGVLGGPVSGLFMADPRPSNEPRIEMDACQSHTPANLQPASPVEARRIDPESQASASGQMSASQRGVEAANIEAGVGTWVEVLERHRPRLEDCLAMGKPSTALPKISVLIDGPSGRFRNVEPLQLRGRARRCLQETLASLEFAASPARIELTIGLP